MARRTKRRVLIGVSLAAAGGAHQEFSSVTLRKKDVPHSISIAFAPAARRAGIRSFPACQPVHPSLFQRSVPFSVSDDRSAPVLKKTSRAEVDSSVAFA